MSDNSQVAMDFVKNKESVILNQSDRCIRQLARGIQKSMSRVQAHFSLPHSPRQLRRLANRSSAAKVLARNPKQVSLLTGYW